MKAIFILFALLSSASAFALRDAAQVTAKDAIQKSTVLIVIARQGEASELRYSICSGSLISSQVIVTAAHCLERGYEKIYVSFDLHARVPIPQVHGEIDGFVIHPGLFEKVEGGIRQTVGNDIALLKLSAPAPAHKTPIKLATAPPVENEVLMIAGYGPPDESPIEETALRQADALFAGEGQMVATELAVMKGNTATTHGDSGGPVFTQDECEARLVGVNSISTTDRKTNENISVYAPTWNKIDWIKDYLD